MCKDSRQNSCQSNCSYGRYVEKLFTKIYRDLYGDAMLVLIWVGTNMAAGNHQKHLSSEFCYKSADFEELKNIILFLMQKLFG